MRTHALALAHGASIRTYTVMRFHCVQMILVYVWYWYSDCCSIRCFWPWEKMNLHTKLKNFLFSVAGLDWAVNKALILPRKRKSQKLNLEQHYQPGKWRWLSTHLSNDYTITKLERAICNISRCKIKINTVWQLRIKTAHGTVKNWYNCEVVLLFLSLLSIEHAVLVLAASGL